MAARGRKADEVARTLNGNYQYEAFGRLVPEREGLAGLLLRDPVDHGEVPIGGTAR